MKTAFTAIPRLLPKVRPPRQTVEGPTGIAGEAHLGKGVPDMVDVANADLVFERAFDGEVFTEGAGGEIEAAGRLPPPVMIERVDAYRTVPAAVVTEVALPVSVEAFPAEKRGFHR